MSKFFDVGGTQRRQEKNNTYMRHIGDAKRRKHIINSGTNQEPASMDGLLSVRQVSFMFRKSMLVFNMRKNVTSKLVYYNALAIEIAALGSRKHDYFSIASDV